jgi:transcriptional regulator with XRE-family HTH domain
MANRIEYLRRRRGLTQEQLAELMNCRHSTIHRWEREKTVDWISRVTLLAKALQCHPGEIFCPLPNDPMIDKDEQEILNVYRELDDSQKDTLSLMVKALSSSTRPTLVRTRKRA